MILKNSFDEWLNIISSVEFVEKNEEFEDVKNSSKAKTANTNSKYKPNYRLDTIQGPTRNNTKKDKRVKYD